MLLATLHADLRETFVPLGACLSWFAHEKVQDSWELVQLLEAHSGIAAREAVVVEPQYLGLISATVKYDRAVVNPGSCEHGGVRGKRGSEEGGND